MIVPFNPSNYSFLGSILQSEVSYKIPHIAAYLISSLDYIDTNSHTYQYFQPGIRRDNILENKSYFFKNCPNSTLLSFFSSLLSNSRGGAVKKKNGQHFLCPQ